jgi:hypothetical protein
VHAGLGRPPTRGDPGRRHPSVPGRRPVARPSATQRGNRLPGRDLVLVGSVHPLPGHRLAPVTLSYLRPEGRRLRRLPLPGLPADR